MLGTPCPHHLQLESGKHIASVLGQGSTTPGQWTGTSLKPVRIWAAQQVVSCQWAKLLLLLPVLFITTWTIPHPSLAQALSSFLPLKIFHYRVPGHTAWLYFFYPNNDLLGFYYTSWFKKKKKKKTTTLVQERKRVTPPRRASLVLFLSWDGYVSSLTCLFVFLLPAFLASFPTRQSCAFCWFFSLGLHYTLCFLDWKKSVKFVGTLYHFSCLLHNL